MENKKIISILWELWRYKDTDKYSESEIRAALESAISALSADVSPNIHATWEKVSTDKYIQSANYRYRCSMCGELTIGEPNFCPTCGADMREPIGEKGTE